VAVSIVFSFSVKEFLNNFLMSEHGDLSLLFACINDVFTVVVLHVEVFQLSLSLKVPDY